MPDFRHLLRMTDKSGILQFSQYEKPDPRSGYTLDDNARALLVIMLTGNDNYHLAENYINYLYKAQLPDGNWFNILLNNRFSSRFDSEDSIGRAILACSIGTQSSWPDINNICSGMLRNSLPLADHFTSPRGIAYVLTALCKGNIPHLENKEVWEMVNRLTANLIRLYRKNRMPGWNWFEDRLTYCNGILAHAMLSAYSFNNDKEALKIGRESLDFLNAILFKKGYLSIIGNKGWYSRGSQMASFDQQPVDAASIALACQEAYKVIGKKDYYDLATLAHRWYRGLNIHGISLYDENTGGCYDALTEDGVNLNQGAESLLSLLLTDLVLEESAAEAPANNQLICNGADA